MISHKNTFKSNITLKANLFVFLDFCPPPVYTHQLFETKKCHGGSLKHWWPVIARNSESKINDFLHGFWGVTKIFTQIGGSNGLFPLLHFGVQDLLHSCFKELSLEIMTAVLHEYHLNLWREPIKNNFPVNVTGNQTIKVSPKHSPLLHQSTEQVHPSSWFFGHPNRRDTAASTSQAEDSKAWKVKMLEV